MNALFRNVAADVLAISAIVGLIVPPASGSVKRITRVDYSDNQETGNVSPIQPSIDRYGQLIDAQWSGKTSDDSDLLADRSREEAVLKDWLLSSGKFDRYGGYLSAGWHVEATGYFTVVKHKSVWWLITPLGNPCFYTGVDTAPALTWETTPVTGRADVFAELDPHDGVTADAWAGDPWGTDPGITSYAFCAANLIRKYGTDWKSKFRSLTAERLAAWGFTGLGKWADPIEGVPYTPVLNRTGVPVLVNHPDPFDSVVAQKLHDVLAAQITPQLNDPTVVAWSLGNEGAEIITSEEIENILDSDGNVLAKRALIDYVLAVNYEGNVGKLEAAWLVQPVDGSKISDLYGLSSSYIPANDIEVMRQYYADTYYALIRRTIKSIDPNHLYAGFWIVPGDWENESDWLLIARHCDVVGYDNYFDHFESPLLKHLLHLTDKPVFCGEFSFPQDAAERGFSIFTPAHASTEVGSGKLYRQYVGEAARNPYCVGLNWFQYRDQPITGRGPGYGPDQVYGENYAFGLVTVTDQPKWNLLEAIRAMNLTVPTIRTQLK